MKKLFLLLASTLGVGAATVFNTDSGLSVTIDSNGQVTGVSMAGNVVTGASNGGLATTDFSVGPGPNLLSNPGFETAGGTGWSLSNAADDNTIHHSGTNSMKISVAGVSGSVGRVITVSPSTRYRLSFWLRKGDGATTEGAYYWLQQSDGTPIGSQVGLVQGLLVNETWTLKSVDFTTTALTGKVYIYASLYLDTGSLWVDDVALNDLTPVYTLVSGTVANAPGGKQVSGSTGVDLTYSMTYVTNGGNLFIAGSVTNTTGADRAIGVRFSLPVDLNGWTWYNDMYTNWVVNSAMEYANTLTTEAGDGLRSWYPIASLSSGTNTLTIGVPVVPPKTFRVAYDNVGKQLYATMFLGLTASSTKFVKSGTFNMVAWVNQNGFRGALKHYYTNYPTFFTKRQTFEAPYNYGLNEVFNRTTHELEIGSYHFPDMLDYGEGLDFIQSLHGVAYDVLWNTNSVTRPTDVAVEAYLPTQSPPWLYPGIDALLQLAHDSAGAIRYTASSYDAGIPQWYLEFFCNQDPELTMGLCDTIQTATGAYYATPHQAWGSAITTDFGEGGSGSLNLDYNVSHIAATDASPTFGNVTLAPAIMNSMYDFYSTYLYPKSGTNSFVIMGNTGSPDHLYCAPFVDIGMTEMSRTMAEQRFYRAMSYQKLWRNWTTLDSGYYDEANFTSELMTCLSLAFYPSLGMTWPNNKTEVFRPLYRTYLPAIEELSAAGWEPVTYATVANGVGERYGSFTNDTLCYSVMNETAGTVTATVTLDLTGLGVPGGTTLVGTDLLTRGSVTVTAGVFSLVLTNGQTRAVWVGDTNKRWHRSTTLALRALGRLRRAFTNELQVADNVRLNAIQSRLIGIAANGELSAVSPVVLSELDTLRSGITTAAPSDLGKQIVRVRQPLGTSLHVTSLKTKKIQSK